MSIKTNNLRAKERPQSKNPAMLKSSSLPTDCLFSACRKAHHSKSMTALLMTMLLLAGMLLLGACTAPATQPPADELNQTEAPAAPVEPVDVRVAALKGPTAMGMVKMMDDNDKGALTDNNYSFSISSAVDEIPPLIVKGEVDIAAVPANLAAVLYNNTDGAVRVLAINTLGVLYILEDGATVNSFADLKGKTIYASGKGATPEYVLTYLLKSNGLDATNDVNIEWLPEHAACVSALAQNPEAVAMLPQPFVTTAQAQNDALRVALDLTAEWDKTDTDSSLVTGVVIARKAFIEENPEACAAFLDHYRKSVAYANDDVDGAATLVGAYDIVPEPVAKKALPACNIVCITGDELVSKLEGYLTMLHQQNPDSVGGKLPPADFYYKD